MALEDRDIFASICEVFAGQPIEVIMEQYEKAKMLNMAIEKRVDCAINAETTEAAPENGENQEEQTPPKKRYTRRQLKVKPEEAITDEAIYCCICGGERSSLTKKHLDRHGISVADYKKLCGYDPKQPLMSNNQLANSRQIIGKAQKKRLDKMTEANA